MSQFRYSNIKVSAETKDVKTPQIPQGSGPASVLGQICEVHFLEDKEWYKAIVRGYDKASKFHNLWYYFDEEVSSFQLPSLSFWDIVFRAKAEESNS